MHEYVYGYCFEQEGDEVFFKVLKFPEIITSLQKSEIKDMGPEEIDEYVHDALVVALQAYIYTRRDIPDWDDPKRISADGFVRLVPRESMKIELYKLYKENCSSIADFARKLQKTETGARRLLDLKHQSWQTEIEAAISIFGKRLVHGWDVEVARSVPGRPSRKASSRLQPA